MATFEERVEGLTGLGIESANSNPTQAQLSEFLKDGVADVVDRWTTLRPQDAFLFTRGSSVEDSQGALSANSGKIISVVRESGTDGDFRECARIPLGMQSRVTDKDSLYYASHFNPAYALDADGKVLVYPTPSASNGYKIYYINSQPVNTSDATLAYSHSDIKYFPEEKVRLVVLYAGMRALQAAMGGMHNSADIDAAYTSFKSNMLLGIQQLDLSKVSVERIDENLYNVMNFDTVRGRFKQVHDALAKAEDLVSGAAPATGYNAFSYHLREDPELVGSALKMSASELSRAQGLLTEMNSMEELAIKEAQSYIAIGTAYVQDAQQYLSQVQSLSAEENKEYTWYDSRYREIKAEYDQAFGLYKEKSQALAQKEGS
tara:strand:+ start:50 stop:1174 length:1125 start_codon:yes stop_codon:yes gene_type:complete